MLQDETTRTYSLPEIVKFPQINGKNDGLHPIHANIGAWHMNLWAYTMVEMWAWDQPESKLVNRKASPWDYEPRRPSHLDRRKALLSDCLANEFRAAQTGTGQRQKLRNLAKRLFFASRARSSRLRVGSWRSPI